MSYLKPLLLILFLISCEDRKSSLVSEKKLLKKPKIEVTLENYKSLTKEDWLKVLTPEEYRIIWEKGTEPSYTARELLDEKREGIFFSKALKIPLFITAHKYSSGTGWPSFYNVIKEENLTYETDYLLGYGRKEVMSSAKEHLGHVFSDGPIDKGGLRYCINGASLVFVPYEKLPEEYKKLHNDARK